MTDRHFWLFFWMMAFSAFLALIWMANQPDQAQVEAAKRWSPQEYQCVYGSFERNRDRQEFCERLPGYDGRKD